MSETRRSGTPPPTIVIDASLAMRTLGAGSGHALVWLAEQRRAKAVIAAPDLWLAEIVSAVRNLVFAELLTQSEGTEALDSLFALGVEIVPSTPERCHRAFEWAGRLRQAKAYDGFYLATAEERQAEFWTADLRLANRARQVGAAWAHCLSDG